MGVGVGTSTDPAVIHAITQTMIGEFLHKYTTKTITKGFSEKRHRRFFWVHPYTKTLYWSTVDPGAGGHESIERQERRVHPLSCAPRRC